jgi:hypothetical protein
MPTLSPKHAGREGVADHNHRSLPHRWDYVNASENVHLLAFVFVKPWLA